MLEALPAPDRPVAVAVYGFADETGQSKAALVREAIREHLEELDDIRLAKEVLANPGRLYTAEEAKRELGI